MINVDKKIITIGYRVTKVEKQEFDRLVEFLACGTPSKALRFIVNDFIENNITTNHKVVQNLLDIDNNINWLNDQMNPLNVPDDTKDSDFERIKKHRKQLKKDFQELKRELQTSIKNHFKFKDHLDIIPYYDSLEIFTNQDLTSTELDKLKLFLGFDNFTMCNPKGCYLFSNKDIDMDSKGSELL